MSFDSNLPDFGYLVSRRKDADKLLSTLMEKAVQEPVEDWGPERMKYKMDLGYVTVTHRTYGPVRYQVCDRIKSHHFDTLEGALAFILRRWW